MEKVLEFFSNNSAVLSVLLLVAGGLIGKFLPVAMFKTFGIKCSGKVPDSMLKIFNDRIDAFQEGLANVEHEGRIDITSNEQIKEATDKLKTDISKLGK